MTKIQVEEDFKNLQNKICLSLQSCDGKALFIEDLWDREGGGGGRTRVLENGAVFEKAGVNFSAVSGTLSEAAAKQLGIAAGNFFATGVSIVVHPNNPHVPIIHMNVRYFEMEDGTSWYGGGIDLTPHYINNIDAQFFHTTLKDTCDEFDSAFYPKFKTWADNYFYLPHRKETRGVGGIFFDRLKPQEYRPNQIHDFVLAIGNQFAPTYTTIVNRNKELTFTEEQRNWQLLRRGRYVEFNLAYDRGTRFGLETNGRTESILMSLPNQANWTYNFKAEPNSEEQNTLDHLKKDIDWISMGKVV
jgi:coproporphyrinogen III oxidase